MEKDKLILLSLTFEYGWGICWHFQYSSWTGKNDVSYELCKFIPTIWSTFLTKPENHFVAGVWVGVCVLCCSGQRILEAFWANHSGTKRKKSALCSTLGKRQDILWSFRIPSLGVLSSQYNLNQWLPTFFKSHLPFVTSPPHLLKRIVLIESSHPFSESRSFFLLQMACFSSISVLVNFNICLWKVLEEII